MWRSVVSSFAASASAAGVTVTVCAVFQLFASKVNAVGLTPTSGLGVGSAIPTVTRPPGRVFKRTVYRAVGVSPPAGSATVSAAVLTRSPALSSSVTSTVRAALTGGVAG